MGMHNGAAVMEDRGASKIKTELTYDPSISLLGVYQKR